MCVPLHMMSACMLHTCMLMHLLSLMSDVGPGPGQDSTMFLSNPRHSSTPIKGGVRSSNGSLSSEVSVCVCVSLWVLIFNGEKRRGVNFAVLATSGVKAVFQVCANTPYMVLTCLVIMINCWLTLSMSLLLLINI